MREAYELAIAFLRGFEDESIFRLPDSIKLEQC